LWGYLMTEQRKQLLQLIADLRDNARTNDYQVGREGLRIAQVLQNILEGKGYDDMSTYQEGFVDYKKFLGN